MITINSKLKFESIKKTFGNKPFTNKQLFALYRKDKPDLKETTFRWRVYELKEKNCIYSISRGVYMVGAKNEFSPLISKKNKKLYQQIHSRFPYINFCIWETAWLHNYMIHQPVIDNTIIEVEKEAASSVFYFLQESMNNVFLNPDEQIIDNYIDSHTKNIIVKNLITTSPVIIKENIKIPKAEKIIVDLFIEKYLYKAYQNQELVNICNALLSQYVINCSNLYWYAEKRCSKQHLINFIESNNLAGCLKVNK